MLMGALWFGAIAALLIGLFGPLYWPKCPICGHSLDRFIYMGLPLWGCSEKHKDDEEGCLNTFGFGALVMVWVCEIIPFNGKVYRFSGPYLVGVVAWLFHVEQEEEDE